MTEPSIVANGSLRGFLIVKKGATDLSDTSVARFVSAGKFGSTAVSAGFSGGDNLGNHLATTTLNGGANVATNFSTVYATAFVGDGSGLTGIPLENLSDVADLSGAAADEVLTYSAAGWTNAAASGGGITPTNSFAGDPSALLSEDGTNYYWAAVSSPYFSVTLTADWDDIPDVTQHPVPWDSVMSDSHSGFNTNTYTYTVPVSGFWSFGTFLVGEELDDLDFSLTLLDVTSGGTGIKPLSLHTWWQNTGAAEQNFDASIFLQGYCAAGAEISMRFQHNDAGDDVDVVTASTMFGHMVTR